MQSFNIIEVLRLGAIGLSFVLAFLAYRVLKTEQARTSVRKQLLAAAYVFMAFSLVLCWWTTQKELKEKALLATQLSEERQLSAKRASEDKQLDAKIELQKLQRIPNINWDYKTVGDGHHFQCTANGSEIAAPLHCKDFGTCSNREGNTLICAGKYYAAALAREHAQPPST